MSKIPKIKKSYYANFINDRYYFRRYYLVNLCVLITGSIAIEFFWNRSQEFNHLWLWITGLVLFVLPNFFLIFVSGICYLGIYLFSQPLEALPGALLWLPVGAFLGVISAAMIHNASHANFRPKWINRFLGELNGLAQLSGFIGWSVSHTIHHMVPDDPVYDAHPPGTLSFSQYQNVMGTQMKNNITNKYFDVYGQSEETKRIWKQITLLLPVVRFTRVFFLMHALGPVAFVFFFVPFKITNALIFSDFNYRTHRPNSEGDIEVHNLNHNLFYKFLNSVTWGSYYHKNHHRKPTVLDPRTIPNSDEPLVSFSSSKKAKVSAIVM